MSDPAHEPTILKNASRISSAAERTAYLDEACGEDAALRERIEVQLASDCEPAKDDQEETVNPIVLTSDSGRVVPQLKKPSVEIEAAEVMDFGTPSILHSLAQTVDVPRVALRTEDEDSKPQPDSDSKPSAQSRNSSDRCRLDREIARGGMGAILKGHDADLGRDLAIKVLLDFHRDDPTVIQRFVEEAQIGGQLQHPGIAPDYEVGLFADSRPFFSMKLVKGETLADLLKSRTDPSEDRSRFIGIFEQISQTMAYAHSRGVIHRDLKPANIMVGAFGEVQVMDWALPKSFRPTSMRRRKSARILARTAYALCAADRPAEPQAASRHCQTAPAQRLTPAAFSEHPRTCRRSRHSAKSI